MLVLSLLWLLGGALLGALTYAAALMPAAWRGRGWRTPVTLVMIGAIAGLGGGWAGTLVFGRIYGSPAAAGFAIASGVLFPQIFTRALARLRPDAAPGAPPRG